MALAIGLVFLPEGVPVFLVMLGAFGLFGLVVVVDGMRTPNPAGFTIDRDMPKVVGLSRWFTRDVRISGLGPGLSVTLHEDFPDCCVVGERTVDGERSPADERDPSGGPDTFETDDGGIGVCRRTYRSERRGGLVFGDLRISVESPLGLVHRQARFAGGQGVAVESALADLSSTLALAASERWRDLGVRKIRRRGGQTEFESLRDYVRGDDVRLVDWKAFAKRGKPTVRQYQEERGQELVILFDCGRRMRATAPGRSPGARDGDGSPVQWSKLDWSLDAGLQLAAVALQQGDRVGCMVFDDRLRAFVPPARSSRQFARLRDAVYATQPSRRDTDLARALRELGVRYRRRATVVVLSDVADPLSVAAERTALSTGSRRHRIIFAAIDDPELRDAIEAPLGETVPGELPPVALRAGAMSAVDTRNRSLRQLAASGIRVLDALPAEAAGPLLAAWLDERRGG